MHLSFKDRLRLLVATVIRSRLRFGSRLYRPESGSALIVSPHPDDESLGCGGLIAAKARACRRVDVVFLTAGEASHRGHPRLSPGELGRIRQAEAIAALTVLGLDAGRAHFWDVPDGQIGQVGSASTAMRLKQLILDLRPDEVFVPLLADGSTEHSAAFSIASLALISAGGGRLVEYPVWGWWNPFRLQSALLRDRTRWRLPLGAARELKRRAVACHRSQIEPTPPWTNPVLPPVLAAACCGPEEFFFARNVAPIQPR